MTRPDYPRDHTRSHARNVHVIPIRKRVYK